MIAYSKVVEFQVRGAVHVHAPIRLDGPDGADGPAPDLPMSPRDLEDAIQTAAGKVSLDAAPLRDGTDLPAALGPPGRHPHDHRRRRPRQRPVRSGWSTPSRSRRTWPST